MRFKDVELEAGVLWLEAEPESVVEVAGATLSKGDEEAGTKGDAVTRNNESRAGADEVAGTGAVEVASSLMSTDTAEAGTGAVEEEASTDAVEVAGSLMSTDAAEAGTGAVEEEASTDAAAL
jgi:hypothetical protein